MRAVDFACSFLVNLSHIDLTPNDTKVLIALATGLSCAHDIAERLDIRPCASTFSLKSMAKRHLVRPLDCNRYMLAPAGESKVRQLLMVYPTKA